MLSVVSDTDGEAFEQQTTLRVSVRQAHSRTSTTTDTDSTRSITSAVSTFSTTTTFRTTVATNNDNVDTAATTIDTRTRTTSEYKNISAICCSTRQVVYLLKKYR